MLIGYRQIHCFARITSRLSSCSCIVVETCAFESDAFSRHDSCTFRSDREHRTRRKYRGMVNENIHWYFSESYSCDVPIRAERP